MVNLFQNRGIGANFWVLVVYNMRQIVEYGNHAGVDQIIRY